MKSHLTLLYLVLFCILPYVMWAQGDILPKPVTGIQLYPDSIRIEFQDLSAILLMQFKRGNNDLQKINEFQIQLKTIDKLVRESLPTLDEPKRVSIIETTNEEWKVEITDIKSSTQLRVKGNLVEELLPPGWELDMVTSYSIIHLYVHEWGNIEALANEDFNQITKSIQSQLAKQSIGRKRIISRTIVANKAVTFSEAKFQMPVDMLAINASFGFGFYRNSYAPELNLSTMVVRNDHFNRPYTQFGLIYENKFFTSKAETGGFTTHTNSFLSLGFSINAYKLNDPFWIGFGGGLLVRKSGDYFTGNTAKFFITTGSNKIRVIPEFYLTNDFKTFSLGGKLSYTF